MIRSASGGAFDVLDGSRYAALHRLEEREWERRSGSSDKGKRAKFYELTARGRHQLRSESARRQRYADAVASMLGATTQPAEGRAYRGDLLVAAVSRAARRQPEARRARRGALSPRDGHRRVDRVRALAGGGAAAGPVTFRRRGTRVGRMPRQRPSTAEPATPRSLPRRTWSGYALRGSRRLKRPGFAATVISSSLSTSAPTPPCSPSSILSLSNAGRRTRSERGKQIYIERQPKKGARYFQARFSLPEARFIDSSLARGGVPSAVWLRMDADVEIRDGAVRRAKSAWVTPRFLSVLGVRPVVGTDFDAESARFGVPASTAIISWAFWQRELGGDPGALGRVIHVAGRPATIRAITPRGFAGIDLGGAEMRLPPGGFTGFHERPGQPPWYEAWGTIAYQVVASAPTSPSEQQFIERTEAGVRSAAAFVAADCGRARGPTARTARCPARSSVRAVPTA